MVVVVLLIQNATQDSVSILHVQDIHQTMAIQMIQDYLDGQYF